MTTAERQFDLTATAWDNIYEGRDPWAHRVTSRLDAAVELVGPGPGTVLDVGAGSGRLLEALADRGWTVYGIDPVPQMVELARARLPAASKRLVVGRAEELPFEDGAFDVATVVGVLEYAAVDGALAELARVLRPGGRALIGLHTCMAPTTIWHLAVMLPVARRVKRFVPFGRRVPFTAKAVGVAEAIRGLTGAGLIVEHVVPVGAELLPDPLDRFAPGLAYRAGRRAERSQRLKRVFATQRLIVARKP
jgi:SAM-dependent methyltransferase